MNNYKLPVLEIFFKALSLPIADFRFIAKAGLPLVMCVVVTILVSRFTTLDEKNASLFLISLVFGLAFCVSLVMAIVGCHRIFILKDRVINDIRPFEWTGNEFKYAGWWILIGICAGVVALPFMLLLVPFMGNTLNAIWDNKVFVIVLIGLINLPLYYLVSRWSLVLPSSAIGKHGKSLTWSWKVTENNGWRLMILIGLIPFCVDLFFELLPNSKSITYALLVGAAWLLVGVFEICLLSLSYAYFESIEDGRLIAIGDSDEKEQVIRIKSMEITQADNGAFLVGSKEFNDRQKAEEYVAFLKGMK